MYENLYSIIETDLKLLTTEARKSDGFAQQITAFIHHSEVPQIKDGCEKASMKLRNLARESRGIAGIRESLVGLQKAWGREGGDMNNVSWLVRITYRIP